MNTGESGECIKGTENTCHRHRPTSFWMHDPEVVFRELNLKKGDVFLDLGCGAGDYSICASEEIGETGIVYAADIRCDLIENLKKNIRKSRLRNIKPVIANLNCTLPFENKSIDFCLLSTVLHTLKLKNIEITLFPEIRRILKTSGRLSIIECKKEETEFGPPISMKISPKEIEEILIRHGFEKQSYTDLGNNYMLIFSPNKD